MHDRWGRPGKTGTDEAFIVHAKPDRYYLDPQLIEVDLWEHRAASHQSENLGDDAELRAALHQAVMTYKGELVSGEPYDWAEPEREALRRTAVEAHSRLARHLEGDGDLETAVTVLNRALEHDRYNEQLYQRIIGLQATLSDRDGVRRTYHLLVARAV